MKRPHKVFVCAYDYTDLYYELVFQKVRYRTNDLRGKTFLIRHPDRTQPGGWSFGKPQGFERYLYNLPQVFWATQHGDDVWWAEGEKDANSLLAAGVVATTHGGAGNAHPAQAEWFRGHTGRVLLMVDRDGPGARDALQRYEHLRSVGVPAEQVLFLRARGDHKDATDHLRAGGAVHEFAQVTGEQLREAAAHVTPAVMRRHGYGPTR